MGDGGTGDLSVDKESVQRITRGLRDAIGELREVGDGTGAVLGKGFSQLAMTGMEAGHHGLSVDFEDFCERWEWGVRALIQDANTIAKKLGLAAGLIWEEDRYAEGSFKVLVNAGLGNPYASEEEVVKQDWGDLLTPDYLSPDYSAKSFRQAQDEAAQTWKDTARSLVTEGKGGEQAKFVNDLLGIDQQDFERAVDDAYGPSPEERARGQRQGTEGE
ncbi:MAG TPA: hypothetical protein VFY14_11200 [Streptomyces sp.]|nr:hypothetical protein [Streptomyces sp.]